VTPQYNVSALMPFQRSRPSASGNSCERGKQERKRWAIEEAGHLAGGGL